jgi:predicted dehydrogenase
MKVGVLGLGYWGPNLVRNFLANHNVSSVIGCDENESRRSFITDRFPGVGLCSDFNDMLKMDLDAIAIATPVATHFKFAKAALDSGKHIWVEKPFTSNSDQAKKLIELAKKKKLKIFVDHTFVYTGAVRKMKEIVEKNELGDIIYFDSVRVNLGLFQHDVNVMWDLAPHDISILNYLLPNKKVVAIAANGIANYYDHENVAHISVYFDNNCFAHFHVNWTSPVKIRRMILGGKEKMLVFDDMENIEKIKVYDSAVEMKTKESIHEALVQYRTGDMYSPKVKQTEALALGVEEFIASIKEDRKPLTSGLEGLQVIKILEAADESVKNKGKLIKIS